MRAMAVEAPMLRHRVTGALQEASRTLGQWSTLGGEGVEGKPPKRQKPNARTYMVKERYTTHHARADVGKKITKLIEKIADGKSMVSTVGWTFEEESCEEEVEEVAALAEAPCKDKRKEKKERRDIIADARRYRELIKEASRLLKGSEAQKTNFA